MFFFLFAVMDKIDYSNCPIWGVRLIRLQTMTMMIKRWWKWWLRMVIRFVAVIASSMRGTVFLLSLRLTSSLVTSLLCVNYGNKHPLVPSRKWPTNSNNNCRRIEKERGEERGEGRVFLKRVIGFDSWAKERGSRGMIERRGEKKKIGEKTGGQNFAPLKRLRWMNNRRDERRGTTQWREAWIFLKSYRERRISCLRKKERERKRERDE